MLKVKNSYKLLLVVGVMLLSLVFGFGFLDKPTLASNNEKERLITIYDRGQEKIILTEAKTTADALKDADVYLDSKDIVEPALEEELVSSTYNINIYRARPVTVVDGILREKIITAYQTPEQIAKVAGIDLYPEDKTKIVQASISSGDGAGLELFITRAKQISFTVFGKTSVVRTQAKTVEGLLKEKDIKLDSNDKLSSSLDQVITEGLAIKLWREGKQTVSLEEQVSFGVERVFDSDREIGYKAVKQPGVNGQRSVTYEIVIQDGQEVSRKEIASLILEAPKTQIEIVGSKPKYTFQGEASKIEWMRQAGISESDFGYVDYIINKESRWNPSSINKTSGACGLAQALPCSKVPGDPLNPVDNLRWANSYAQTCTSWRKYCGWEGAYQFWLRNNWW